MFGPKKIQEKKTAAQVKKELAAANKKIDSLTPDLVVDKPVENAGMPGFTTEAAPEAPAEDTGIPGFGSIGAPVVAPAPEVVPQVPAPAAPSVPEQYKVIGIELAEGEGLYVYKIVTNKYLGELGGVYEA